ncbi:hypothetical protein VNO77_03224 [Canavalia gladiata]|uniref:Uncharacterized protein n=1 Tax=Canavalia gladiata TaxID=3824 RepID=A0AAN9N0T1_CANGL
MDSMRYRSVGGVLTQGKRAACSSISLANGHGYVLPMLLINRLERCKDDEGRGDSTRRRNDLRYSVLRFEGRINGRRLGVRRTFPQIALRLGDRRPS